MAFITYRVSTTPTLATANVAKGLQLTNSEIDANFKALDDGKLEKNGSAASLTGLPLTTGVTGILPVANGGTGSSTASTGSGGVVLATSPTLVTPSLGIPSFLDLTNARNLPLDGTIAVSGKLPIAFGGTNSIAIPTAGTIPYGTGTAYAFTAAGTTGQVLTSAGTGTPTWATITTSAGGSNTQLQYNSSGSFAGSANMTFNGTTLALNSLSVTNNVTAPTFLGQVTFSNNSSPGIVIGNGTSDTGISFNSTSYSSISVGNGGTFWVKNAGGTNFLSANVTAVSIPLTTASTSTSTGALTVVGGVGIAGRLNIGSTVTTPDVTSLLTTANTYPTTRPSLNLDFANSATLDPRITFTRGTNATYTGSDGLVKNTVGIHSPRFDWDPVTRECKGLLIEEARTNLFTYSEQFDNAIWSKLRSTVYSNAIIAPDGTLGADKLVEDTQTGAHHLYKSYAFTGGTTYTSSIFVKAGERTRGIIQLGNGLVTFNGTGSATCSYNIIDKTAFLSSGLSCGIQEFTNGWFRVWITGTADITGSDNVFISFLHNGSTASYAGDGISGLYIWGAQLEAGAFATSYIPSSVTWTGRASTATYVGSNGLIQTAASGVARYQYNPTNLSVAPFLLLEPAATNLLTYSDDTSNYSYLQDVSITVNQITSPDGSITADKITSTLTGGANTCIVQKQNTIAADTQTYTYSIFVKAGTSPTTTLNLQLAGGTYQQVVGIITWSTNTISTGTLVNYGNGWFKASITLTNNGTNTIIIPRIYVRDQSSANVSGEYAYVWGWQVETGSVATSYIPTVASQVTRIADTSTSAQTTRSADVATMTNSNFSSWYNQTEGTIIINAAVPYPAAYSGYTYMLGSFNDGIYNYRQSDSQSVVRIKVGSTDQFGALGFGATWSTSSINKNALAYKLNDFNSANNGGTPGSSDTSGIVPTVNALTIGSNNGSSYINGTIAKLTYYPTRLSNSTLQALTT